MIEQQDYGKSLVVSPIRRSASGFSNKTYPSVLIIFKMGPKASLHFPAPIAANPTAISPS